MQRIPLVTVSRKSWPTVIKVTSASRLRPPTTQSSRRPKLKPVVRRSPKHWVRPPSLISRRTKTSLKRLVLWISVALLGLLNPTVLQYAVDLSLVLAGR